MLVIPNVVDKNTYFLNSNDVFGMKLLSISDKKLIDRLFGCNGSEFSFTCIRNVPLSLDDELAPSLNRIVFCNVN